MTKLQRLEIHYTRLQYLHGKALRNNEPVAAIRKRMKSVCDELLPLRAEKKRKEWNNNGTI